MYLQNQTGLERKRSVVKIQRQCSLLPYVCSLSRFDGVKLGGWSELQALGSKRQNQRTNTSYLTQNFPFDNAMIMINE